MVRNAPAIVSVLVGAPVPDTSAESFLELDRVLAYLSATPLYQVAHSGTEKQRLDIVDRRIALRELVEDELAEHFPVLARACERLLEQIATLPRHAAHPVQGWFAGLSKSHAAMIDLSMVREAVRESILARQNEAMHEMFVHDAMVVLSGQIAPSPEDVLTDKRLRSGHFSPEFAAVLDL
jgi:hypothetical protein